MADVEKIKTAIGKDDSLSFCLEIFDNPPQVFFFLIFSFIFISYSKPTRFNPGSQLLSGNLYLLQRIAKSKMKKVSDGHGFLEDLISGK